MTISKKNNDDWLEWQRKVIREEYVNGKIEEKITEKLKNSVLINK